MAQYVDFLHRKAMQADGSKNSERQMLLLLIQLLRERFGGEIHLDRRVEAARVYIDDHFFQQISLAQLANPSKRQLSELSRGPDCRARN